MGSPTANLVVLFFALLLLVGTNVVALKTAMEMDGVKLRGKRLLIIRELDVSWRGNYSPPRSPPPPPKDD